MSILMELEESLLSDSPVWMEFLYRYDPKKKQIFAFYEGDEDSSFYRQFIVKFLRNDYELEEIVAGCKNNVLKLQETIDWNRYNKKQIAFFVDRDLSFWLGQSCEYGDNVFVTDGYSVENYICVPQIFRFWLQRFEGFSRATKEEVNNMVEICKYLMLDFEDSMMTIMAKAVVAKRYDSNVALKDYKPLYQFTHCEDGVKFCIMNQNAIDEKWNLTNEDDTAIQKQISEFLNYRENYFVRGKWILVFMLQLGEYMRLNCDFFATSLGRIGKISPTCSVSPSQGFVALAPNWEDDTPKRLHMFLENTYATYMAG